MGAVELAFLIFLTVLVFTLLVIVLFIRYIYKKKKGYDYSIKNIYETIIRRRNISHD